VTRLTIDGWGSDPVTGGIIQFVHLIHVLLCGQDKRSEAVIREKKRREERSGNKIREEKRL